MTTPARTITALIGRVLIIGGTLGGMATLFALLLGRTDFAIGIAAGTAVGMASFTILILTLNRLMHNPTGAKTTAILIIGSLKLLIIGGFIWWLLHMRRVDSFAFLAGFSSVVAALLVAALTTVRSGRCEEIPSRSKAS